MQTMETTDSVVGMLDGDGPAQDAPGEGGGGKYHTVLEVWRAVLEPLESERELRPTADWSVKICNTYHGLELKDMYKVRDFFFDRVKDLRTILDAAIEAEPERLNASSAEEDLSVNSGAYFDLLLEWQSEIHRQQIAWDCLDEDAAAKLAGLAEATKMFFSGTGLVTLLESIKFNLTEDQKDFITRTLNEIRREQEGR